MKMFHSSGTASGKVERMWRWKITIPATAIVPIDAALGDEQDQRQGELDHRAQVGGERPDRRGPQVLGVVAVEAPLRRPPAVPGRVADHHRDHEGEVTVELRGGRPPPDADEDELRGDDHVGQREEEDDRQVAVDLGAGGEEGHLVAQAEQDEEGEQDADRDRVEAAGASPAVASIAVGEQQVERGGDQPRVEGDVEERAPRAAGQRHPLGPGRQPRRPRPQPVEDAADHRREAQGQRQRAGAEAEHLPEHRPDHRLLEDDRLGPPVAEVAEPAQPVGRRRDQQQPAARVEDELDDVEQVDEVGRAEPVQRPVLGEHLDPLQVRAASPLLVLERRWGGFDEAHARGRDLPAAASG